MNIIFLPVETITGDKPADGGDELLDCKENISSTSHLYFLFQILIEFLKCMKMFLLLAQFILSLHFQVFRHGTRNPEKMEVYANDEYFNKQYFPEGFGALTNVI